MNKHIEEYKSKLKKGICDYMQNPVSERSADAVRTMIKCWKEVNKLEKMMSEYDMFTYDDMKHWNSYMENADGTTGGHWTMDQTSAVADSIDLKFDHITECEWNVAMNMIYSDYSEVAEKFGVGTPEFYADMAKAFLFDKDGGSPKHKLAAYYHSVVETGDDE